MASKRTIKDLKAQFRCQLNLGTIFFIVKTSISYFFFCDDKHFLGKTSVLHYVILKYYLRIIKLKKGHFIKEKTSYKTTY